MKKLTSDEMDILDEEFEKAEALIKTLQHVYYFETGAELKTSYTCALLCMAEDHMKKFRNSLEKFVKEGANETVN